jgi:hypothetical protein
MKKNIHFLISKVVFTFMLAILFACAGDKSKKDQVVARVYDKYLLAEDIENLVPYGTTSKDSVVIVKDYIESWTRNMLLLKKAELNLSPELLDVQKQLDDYRTSLIIFNYERELLKQKLDTSIAMEEVEKYYREHEQNFQLRSNIIRLRYVKLPAKTPNLDKARKWYRSDKDDELDKLAKLANLYAVNYLLDDNNWLIFDEVLKEIPLSGYSADDFNRNKRYFEINDGQYIYLVAVKGFMMKESKSPLSFEMDNIRKIILNKRKQALIELMQQDIYNDAIQKNEVEIFEK